jgi:hypothetical protein
MYGNFFSKIVEKVYTVTLISHIRLTHLKIPVPFPFLREMTAERTASGGLN